MAWDASGILTVPRAHSRKPASAIGDEVADDESLERTRRLSANRGRVVSERRADAISMGPTRLLS